MKSDIVQWLRARALRANALGALLQKDFSNRIVATDWAPLLPEQPCVDADSVVLMPASQLLNCLLRVEVLHAHHALFGLC